MDALAAQQIEELRHVAGSRALVSTNAKRPRVAHELVRNGYLTCYRNSDQVRGERRYYWWTFELTEKGRAALACPTCDGSGSEW